MSSSLEVLQEDGEAAVRALMDRSTKWATMTIVVTRWPAVAERQALDSATTNAGSGRGAASSVLLQWVCVVFACL